MTVKDRRLIPLEEVLASGEYDDMVELARIFNHGIEDVDGVWRWQSNKLIRLITNHENYTVGMVDLNCLWAAFYDGKFTCEELMKFYMGMGYSLCGFGEVFGQKEAHELGLPGAKVPEDGEGEDDYIQTPIDYMIEKYSGQVLKI